MKVLGSLIREFWFEYWPELFIYELDPGDLEIDNEYGEFILDDYKYYDLNEFGYLMWNSLEDAPDTYKGLDLEEWVGFEFEDAFKHFYLWVRPTFNVNITWFRTEYTTPDCDGMYLACGYGDDVFYTVYRGNEFKSHHEVKWWAHIPKPPYIEE